MWELLDSGRIKEMQRRDELAEEKAIQDSLYKNRVENRKKIKEALIREKSFGILDAIEQMEKEIARMKSDVEQNYKWAQQNNNWQMEKKLGTMLAEWEK